MKRLMIFLLTISIVLGLLLTGFFFVGPLINRIGNVYLPDVVGLSVDEAIFRLNSLDLEVVVEEVVDETAGTVIRMRPTGNQEVKEKSEVILYVGVEINTMPNIENKYYQDIIAEVDLVKAKYQNEVIVIDEVDNDLPNGYVKKQIPEAGAIIFEETTIIIYRVIHDNTVVIPNMIGWSIDDVKRFQNNNDLFFEYVFDYSFDFTENQVIAQSAKPGQEIIKNGKNYITITISKGLLEIPDFSGMDIEAALFIADYLDIEMEVVFVKSNARVNEIIMQEAYISTQKRVLVYVSG